MKSTEHFKNTIKAYLGKRASENELFAITYASEKQPKTDVFKKSSLELVESE